MDPVFPPRLARLLMDAPATVDTRIQQQSGAGRYSGIELLQAFQRAAATSVLHMEMHPPVDPQHPAAQQVNLILPDGTTFTLADLNGRPLTVEPGEIYSKFGLVMTACRRGCTDPRTCEHALDPLIVGAFRNISTQILLILIM